MTVQVQDWGPWGSTKHTLTLTHFISRNSSSDCLVAFTLLFPITFFSTCLFSCFAAKLPALFTCHVSLLRSFAFSYFFNYLCALPFLIYLHHCPCPFPFFFFFVNKWLIILFNRIFFILFNQNLVCGILFSCFSFLLRDPTLSEKKKI